VIGGGGDSAGSVCPSSKIADCGGKDTALSRVVQALEEGEDVRVGGAAGHLLNNDVRMAFDLALAVELLRGSVVVGLGVDEVARFNVVDVNLDRELCVGGDFLAVLGVGDLGGWHVGGGRDSAHGGRVTRTVLKLQPICNIETLGRLQAEVDEVVGGSEGGNLACDGRIPAVVFETSGDNPAIQCVRTLGILLVRVLWYGDGYHLGDEPRGEEKSGIKFHVVCKRNGISVKEKVLRQGAENSAAGRRC